MEGDGEAGKPGPGGTGTAAAVEGRPDPIPDPEKPDLTRFSFVRTRQSLAEIINAGKEPDVEMAEKEGRTPPCGGSDVPNKKHPELDGTMDSESGSDKEYDERILDEDYEMKEREVDADGEEESDSSGSTGGAGRGEKGKNEEERIVHVVSPEPEMGPDRMPTAGTSKEGGTVGGGGAAGLDPGAGPSTNGSPDTVLRKKAQEKGEPEEKGQPERHEESENDLEIEEERVDMTDPSLRPDHRYFAVRSMLEKGQQPRKLNPRMKTEENKDSGFVVEGDERWFRNYNYSSIERTVNVSCSFSYDGGCVTCLSGRHDAWGGRRGEPVVIVATDHHFPPNIPVDGEGECIRVLRVEFGSLDEIAKELSRLRPDGGAVPGTVVLYGSVSAMEVESTESYAGKWKQGRNIIKRNLGDVMVIPVIPITPSGIRSRKAIRSLLDMSAWINDLEEPELRFIRNTRKNFEDVNLGRVDKGEGWADTHLNHRMPVSLAEESSGTMPYCTGDWGIRPLAIGPMTEAGERFWILRLIWELNRELKMALGTTVSLSRTMAGINRIANDMSGLEVTCIGASNATRTTEALKKKGVKATLIGKTGWKLSNSSMAAAELELRREGRVEAPVVLHCLDGSVFFAVGKSGAMSIPARGKDGIVHVKGKVSVAKGLQLSQVMDQLEGFLEARKDLLTILVSPSVRFVRPCCLPHDNLPVEEKIEEGKRMLRELGSLRREIRNWLYKKGFRNVVLVDPLESNGAASSWDKAQELMADSVHMQNAGYSKLAGGIRVAVQNWLIGRKRKANEEQGAAEKKPRLGGGEGGPKGGKGPGGKGAGGKGKGRGKGYGYSH
jgi:hypothetical protein